MHQDFSERFMWKTGSRYYLSDRDEGVVEGYLRDQGFLIPGEEVVAVMTAGEGNMNVTLRVMTSRRRIIVKQSRPWVARFPDLDAPVERVLIERDFYKVISRNRYLACHMPELLRADPVNYTLIMEDLGPADDLSAVYAETSGINRKQLSTLLRFASELHALPVRAFPANTLLKKLNHAHIFDLPFRSDNDFPLDAIYPGLAEVALSFQHDEKLRLQVKELGEIFLQEGRSLVHGDFYPGSCLQVEDRLYVIDAEFAHLGRPEFDIGVLMGHLLLSKAPHKRINQIDAEYLAPAGFDFELSRRFCYVEIMRRLIGIAQLPLALSLDERRHLLEKARAALV